MVGVKMCPVCRGSKQKCTPADRIWIPGGQQDKCERCIQLRHDCGPHEYPPPRSRASRASGGSGSSSGSQSAAAAGPQQPVDAGPPLIPRRIEAPNNVAEVKEELRRRLRVLDMQVEATNKLQFALDYLVENGRQSEIIYAELLSSRNANVRILTLMPAQAEALADRLAGYGEIEVAEAAYNRILDAYRAFKKLDIKAWHETKSLLKKLADMLWKIGEPIRAENLLWEALTLRDVPEGALPSDLDLLKCLAASLSKTCVDISRSIQSIVDGAIPTYLTSPFPPLQCMMQSSFASTVSGSPFHKGESPDPSIAQDVSPILGGMETVMDFLRVLPVEALEVRDIYGQSPFYMASSLGMEGLARGILLRLAEVPGRGIQYHLNNRDLMGQTVLGASIRARCSLSYLRFLIENGARVDPDPLRELPWTPLQAAAMAGLADVVRLLLDNGAEVERVYPGNHTPLKLAAQGGHADVIQLLNNAATRHAGPNFDLGWNPG